jgi:protein-L-isoaspartate(D-aspartate) O-methyltransferase
MGFMKLLPQSEEMRRHMVDSQLRTNGVNASWLIAAFLATPREAFVSAEAAATAYMDRSIPLEGGGTLNPPLANGLMLMAAEPRENDRVLLLGTGTDYIAALLAGRVASLARTTDNGPFDLILIDGTIETLPDAIADQLAEGGRIVTGLIEGPVSRLAMGVKRGGKIALRAIADVEIAPLPGFAKAREFVF